MISLKDQEAIQARFDQELLDQVKIDFFTERDYGITVPGKAPCQFCKPTQELLQELAGLSDLISLRVHYLEEGPEEAKRYGIERIPATVLRIRSEPFVTYYGIPAGTEFPGFLECIVDISRGESLLSDESLQSLATLESDVFLKVFVTPTCPYCPQMMRLAFQLALASPHVRAEAIEINEYPELAQKYQVQAVPMTVINDRFAIPGAIGEKDLVDQVLKHSAEGRTVAATEPVERGRERKSGLIIP